jgi:hypothetical protein
MIFGSLQCSAYLGKIRLAHTAGRGTALVHLHSESTSKRFVPLGDSLREQGCISLLPLRFPDACVLPRYMPLTWSVQPKPCGAGAAKKAPSSARGCRDPSSAARRPAGKPDRRFPVPLDLGEERLPDVDCRRSRPQRLGDLADLIDRGHRAVLASEANS